MEPVHVVGNPSEPKKGHIINVIGTKETEVES